jgi:predicted ATPase
MCECLTLLLAVVRRALRDRSDLLTENLLRRLLVVLDNVEHLLPGVLPVLLDVLAAGGGLTVLVTSRAALRLSGEQEFPVPPLSAPRWSQPTRWSRRPPTPSR